MLRKMDNIVIQFLPLQSDRRSFQRVIVNDQVQNYLDKKWVAELRLVQSTGRDHFAIPENLQNLSVTEENRPTDVWADFLSTCLGERQNMDPRAPLTTDTAQASAIVSGPSLLPLAGTRNIETWREQITIIANPDEIVVEPPKELRHDEPRIGRLRRVALDDSDEDDELEPNSAPKSLESTTREKGVTYDRLRDNEESSQLRDALAVDSIDRVFNSAASGDDQDLASSLDSAAMTHWGRGKVGVNKESKKPSQPLVEHTSRSGPRRRVVVAASDSSDNEWVPVKKAGGAGAVTNQPKGNAPNAANLMSTPPKSSTSHGQSGASSVGPRSFPPSFDVHAYGGAGNRSPRRGQAGRARAQDRGSGNFVAGRGRGGPAPVFAQSEPAARGYVPTRGSGRGRSRGQPRNTGPSQTDDRTLVRLARTNNNSIALPAPGLDLRFDSPEPTSPEAANLLDEPLVNIQRPSIYPTTSSSAILFAEAAPPVPAQPQPGSELLYVNRRNPGPDVSAMEEEQMSILRARKAAQKVAGAETKTANKESGRVRNSPQKVQTNDEVASRVFHETMNQGAPNPGKKGKPQTFQETKKERDARIAKAKAEAHGEVLMAKKPSPKVGNDKVDEGMSTKKRQALKQSTVMAATDPVSAEDQLRDVQTEKLIESLSPLLKAGRAFSGKLSFEIQFGQVLLPPVGGQYLSTKDWHQRFQPTDGKFPLAATFTNILTTNGADVDRILDMRSQASGVPRVWSRTNPGPTSVTYEFQCQSKDSEEFLLIVDQSGTYEIRKSNTNVGMVNLHYPGQVWDACAVVFGSLNHGFSDELLGNAKAFVSSLYIPPNLKNVSITYRLPDTNEMTVRNLVMKRVSHHACNVLDRQDLQLQITEAQTLYHQFHKNDKKLGQGFVKDYLQMVNDGQIHYEVSVMHKGVTELLAKNQELELGELTDAWSEKWVLDKQRMRSMVDMISLVVSKIDGVGAKNIGTLFRKNMERLVEEKQLDPSRGLTSMHTSSRLDPGATSHVRGVRGGKAHIVWQDGLPFAYGFGGALVPIIVEKRDSGEDEVAPGDSASQAGDGRAVPSSIRPPTVNIQSARPAAIMTSVQPTAEYGFW